jgi:hypothetical protein
MTMHSTPPDADTRLQALALALELLTAAEPPGGADAAQARAFNQLANRVIARVIATPALALAGLRVKAQAVAWCCASRHDFALGETAGERVIASLLADLLATVPAA